jgi:hypothetical protein
MKTDELVAKTISELVTVAFMLDYPTMDGNNYSDAKRKIKTLLKDLTAFQSEHYLKE